VADSVPLLAEELSSGGYDTAAFVSSLVVRHATGLGRGFRVFDDDFAANRGRDPRDLVGERKGQETVDRAIAWLAARKNATSPFFAWVHLYDPHAPYEPPEPFASRFAGRAYDGEIAYADSCVSQLLGACDPAETAVVLSGDHGESLGEHGEAGHGVFLYDATLRVPLILRLPGGTGTGRRVKAQVRLTDIAPTVRRLAGTAPRESDGEDLVPLLRDAGAPDRAAFSESDYPAFVLGWSPMRSLRLRGAKFIDAPRREYYDLAADPRELHNAYSGDSDAVHRLARQMQGVLSRKALAQATSSAADPEVARRLASLGYIAGGAQAVDYSRIDPTRIDPKDHIQAWAQIESGLIARQTRQFEKAAGIFERLFASYPTINPVVLRDYAEACRKTGRLDRAISLYEKVLRTSSPEPEDFFGLGVAWHLKKDEARACESFERAVALDPSDASSWIDLGNGRLAQRRILPARDAFEHARAADPKSIDALSGLASTAFEEGDYATAERWLGEAVAIAPLDPRTQFNLALVERAKGDPAAAEQIYSRLARSGDAGVASRAEAELRRLKAGG
jgi:tetratricopeptide (TPR) repeat protein